MRKDALSKEPGAMLCAGITEEAEALLTKRQPLHQLQCSFDVQLLVEDAVAQWWQQQGQQGPQSHALVRQALQMIYNIWDLHDALQEHHCTKWAMALVCTHAKGMSFFDAASLNTRDSCFCCDWPHERALIAMHADSGTSTHDRSHADRAGSSDKAEVFHQFALASQDLMVLFGHHHCQHYIATTKLKPFKQFSIRMVICMQTGKIIFLFSPEYS